MKGIRSIFLALALLLASLAPAAATVTGTASSVTAQGNNSATTWAFSFPIPGTSSTDQTNVLVTITDTTVTPATVTVLTTSQYSVTGISTPTTPSSSGTVTYPLSGSPLIAGQFITIQRNIPFTQTTSYPNQGAFFPKTLESNLDYVTELAQGLNTSLLRTLQAPASDAPLLALPPSATRLNAFLAFDANGQPIASLGPTGTPVNNAMLPVFQAASLSAGRTAFQVPGLGDNNAFTGTNTFASTVTDSGSHVFSGTATFSSSATFSGPVSFVPEPQGRLTLVTGVPVMTSDQTAKTTIFYDCYKGNTVPVYNGTGLVPLSIGSCEISMGLDAGVPHITNGNLYDVFAVNNAGTLAICAGPAWSNSTAGSSSRGTGAGTTQLTNSLGVWTNSVSLTHCWGGASGTTDLGAVAANKGTYLGTFYATASGQTGMQFLPGSAAGGTNSFLAVWNAYNRVRITSICRDSNTANTNNSATPRVLDNSTSNRINVVDGLAQSFITSSARAQISTNGAGASGYNIGVVLNSTTATPLEFLGFSQNAGTVSMIASSRQGFTPSLGFNFYQGMEAAANTNAVTIANPNVQLELEM